MDKYKNSFENKNRVNKRFQHFIEKKIVTKNKMFALWIHQKANSGFVLFYLAEEDVNQ